MVLLTDGMANTGVVAIQSIQEQLDSCPNIQRTDVYCMALGSQVNQDLLQSIVVSRSGRLYAIPSPDPRIFSEESSDHLSQSFGDCMGSIMSTLFTNVKLTLDHSHPLTTAFPNRISVSEHETVLEVGTLFVNDSRDILVTLESSDRPFAISLSYLNDILGPQMQMTKGCPHFLEGINAPQRRNSHIRQQQLRINVAQIMNDWEEKRDDLGAEMKAIEEEIRREGWQDVPLCQELLSCLTRLPTLSTMLLRSTSTGLSAQRQTSVGVSAMYTTVLQRARSSEYLHLGGDVHDGATVCGDPSGLPSLPMQSSVLAHVDVSRWVPLGPPLVRQNNTAGLPMRQTKPPI